MRTAREWEVYVGEVVLLVALELSSKVWRLVLGANGRRRQATLEPGDGAKFLDALARAKAKLGLPVDAPVVSCYEAGRDGFWIHRWLAQHGVHNVVIDSSSIEVDRRARRVKTDRVDADKLWSLLYRWYGGDAEALRPVRVPSHEEEDLRVLHRERQSVVKARTTVGNRIKGLLAAQGVKLEGRCSTWRGQLATVRTGDGRPLLPNLRTRLEREIDDYLAKCARIKALEDAQAAQMKAAAGAGPFALIELLRTLRGVGMQSAWTLVFELFGWRRYRNRRELAASVGLVSTPYDSGQSRREQGLSKSGNRRVRTLMIELAWSWLRYQPQSELSQWWRARFSGTQRGRKVGIAALARKLLIALWRMSQNGEVPAGARFSVAR
ncbi:IS110 family transposase [Pseudomarimonas salicorniae]|uniref:IS110 family transposase n=1 Tax=Pseudomarimonas salicorniae TaxID=2933270 RepID=A0ABT0GM69_9GAMM|nr:IS110 family transposase [Lysobacter sp. CAU 1642]MCK7595646.1 IS110 family transposase [Lysobacter sp. CAU 1642]